MHTCTVLYMCFFSVLIEQFVHELLMIDILNSSKAKLSFNIIYQNLWNYFPTVNLVDIYNMIEAFRENGLHVLDHNMEIHESRLEAVLSSIFYALNKRIPSTTDIDVERCIALVKHWLLYAYDWYGECKLQ